MCVDGMNASHLPGYQPEKRRETQNVKGGHKVTGSDRVKKHYTRRLKRGKVSPNELLT